SDPGFRGFSKLCLDMIKREGLLTIANAAFNVITLGVFFPLSTFLASRLFRRTSFRDRRQANPMLGTPPPIIVGPVDLISLDKLRLIAKLYLVGYGLLLQV